MIIETATGAVALTAAASSVAPIAAASSVAAGAAAASSVAAGAAAAGATVPVSSVLTGCGIAACSGSVLYSASKYKAQEIINAELAKQIALNSNLIADLAKANKTTMIVSGIIGAIVLGINWLSGTNNTNELKNVKAQMAQNQKDIEDLKKKMFTVYDDLKRVHNQPYPSCYQSNQYKAGYQNYYYPY